MVWGRNVPDSLESPLFGDSLDRTSTLDFQVLTSEFSIDVIEIGPFSTVGYVYIRCKWESQVLAVNLMQLHSILLALLLYIVTYFHACR